VYICLSPCISHHLDPLGTAQVITNNSASVISNNLYDIFGVLRYQQGGAETPWRASHLALGRLRLGDEELQTAGATDQL